jgi:hypothetical protein
MHEHRAQNINCVAERESLRSRVVLFFHKEQERRDLPYGIVVRQSLIIADRIVSGMFCVCARSVVLVATPAS